MLGVHVASLRLPLTSSLVKLRANALDLSTVQALNMLSSTSWAHLNTMLRGVERCWVKFETGQTIRSTRLNISFVSRSTMRGSTKSSAFAQKRSTCWSDARAVPSISKNCNGSFASFPCSLQYPRSWAFSLCCCSILYCFYAESTLLFYCWSSQAPWYHSVRDYLGINKYPCVKVAAPVSWFALHVVHSSALVSCTSLLLSVAFLLCQLTLHRRD